MSPGGKRTRLLVVWLLLAGLVGLIVVSEHTDLVGTRPNGHSDSAARLLLPVPVEQLGAIEVAYGRALHRFERDAAGAWFYHVHGVPTGAESDHSHDADPAMAQRLEAAFLAFGRARLERRFALQTSGNAYGVTRPALLILVYRPQDRQPLAQYVIGDLAPDTLSRYVLLAESAVVATIPAYHIDNLLALIAAVAEQAEPGPGTPGLP